MKNPKILQATLAALVLLPSLAPAYGYRSYHEGYRHQPARVVYRQPACAAYQAPAPRCAPAPVAYIEPRVVVRTDHVVPVLFAGLILGAAISNLAHGR